MPGSWPARAGVPWWSLKDPRPLSWFVLVGSTAVRLVAGAVRRTLPPRRPRSDEVTHRMAAYAGAGAFLGFGVVPVVGAVPGLMGGIHPAERLRLGRHGEAVAALWTAMRSSVLTELFACLLVSGVWLGGAGRLMRRP